MTASTDKSKQPVAKILVWFLTTVMGAFIGILLKFIWEAPRPVIELLAVELTSEQQQRPLNLPPSLVGAVKDHYYFPRIAADATTEDILDAIQKAEQTDSEMVDINAKIDALIELLRTRTGPVERRRTEFLVAWSAGEISDVLSDVIKVVVGAREDDLPNHYKKHPQGTESLTVSLWPGRIMDLTELDEKEIRQGELSGAGPANAYRRVKRDAHLTNLLRRLWIYLEPDVLIPVMEDAKQVVSEWVQSSKATASQLRAILAIQNPPRLVVKALVTNRGMRPLPIRALGVLRIKIPSRESGTEDSAETIPIKLAGVSDKEVVTVVDGGKAAVIALASIETAQALVEDHPAFQARTDKDELTSSRLQQLYDGGGLSASIGLAQAGANESSVALRPSIYRPIGPQSEEKAFGLLLTE
jgi:hypothetical protein